ncbi:restriction endonuclease subunit S [Shewanella glacialipiscicola]|uniref:restriction endonuclease subunit S n=1 Tax=Shewanella glacialipiscicola TaxID=614069 RepID=UPI0021DB048E|nr:restriction endonuclease subunit S [Shewanella glacialipiscicola]MCU7994456.1 restriction endonuclease subunit S [Shewanella glacialipiscicola]MCU8025927.1 restriction endonuclease subunit S [Shewanella glacialipiscicola]
MSSNIAEPKLRFNNFSNTWQLETLGTFYAFKNGINADKEQYGHGYKFINVLDVLQDLPISEQTIGGLVKVDDKTLIRNAVENGDLLFQRSSETREDVGTSNVYLGHEAVVFGGFVIRGKPIRQVNAVYMNYLLKSSKARKEIVTKSGGSTRYNVGQATLSAVEFFCSCDEDEQQKIAEFLTSVDSKISQLTEKHRLLKEYKKGVMQQLFSQQIRFKDDDGKAFPGWEEKHFGNVFGRIVSKNKENNQNVLTISAQKGLISQLEYFNKSVSAKDVSGYYLLNKGDFAYNKSYSQGYPMGAIKLLKRYEKGVVSTLYICFRPKKGYCESFFEQYFDAGLLNREIAKIAQEGARNHGLLNVSVKEFFDDIKMYVPHLKEQQKIAQFLQSIDKKIDAVALQIEQTKLFKKGLLQQMFV